MMKHQAHGATDITGFGLLGHAQNLVNVQQLEPLDMIIHTLPLIDKMQEVNDSILNFKLTAGYSAETSGGLFVMLDPTRVDGFIRDHKEIYGQDVWVVGEVRKAQDPAKPLAKIREDFEVVKISKSFLKE